MNEVDRNFHDVFCSDIIAELSPSGSMETFLASSIAEEAWRLNHVRAQCENIIAIGHFDGTGDRFGTDHPEIHTAITAASTARDNAKTLELLSLYQQRIHRNFEKYSAQLKTLQAERREKKKEDLEMARKFYQMTEPRNLPYEPCTDGFIFSSDEVARYSRRYYREIAAWQADSVRLDDCHERKAVPRAA